MGSSIKILAVGHTGRDFVRSTAGAFNKGRVDFVVCEDIYSATAKLADNRPNCSLVVVAGLMDLRKHDGRFAEKARQYGAVCCCVVGKEAVRACRDVQSLISRGIVAAADCNEVVRAIEDWVGGLGIVSRDFDEDSAGDDEAFRASEQELDALFGGDFHYDEFES